MRAGPSTSGRTQVSVGRGSPLVNHIERSTTERGAGRRVKEGADFVPE